MRFRRKGDPDLASWHRVFAFLPIDVSPTEYRWLEFVERRLAKREGLREEWRYRTVGSTSEGHPWVYVGFVVCS
jgi:hypothetical protein